MLDISLQQEAYQHNQFMKLMVDLGGRGSSGWRHRPPGTTRFSPQCSGSFFLDIEVRKVARIEMGIVIDLPLSCRDHVYPRCLQTNFYITNTLETKQVIKKNPTTTMTRQFFFRVIYFAFS